MNYSEWYKSLLALVLWRESSGEPSEGKRAVAHVIRNRVLATHLPDTWDDIITAKWQFSSMTAPGDATLVRWPNADKDASFQECLRIASAVYDGTDPDNTNGATHYANLSVCDPKWAHTLKQLAVIGHHTFFV